MMTMLHHERQTSTIVCGRSASPDTWPCAHPIRLIQSAN
jgi:hypothetical protein